MVLLRELKNAFSMVGGFPNYFNFLIMVYWKVVVWAGEILPMERLESLVL